MTDPYVVLQAYLHKQAVEICVEEIMRKAK